MDNIKNKKKPAVRTNGFSSEKVTYSPLKIKDSELLKIFPEAGEIISQKISEYGEEREKRITSMKLFRSKVKEIAKNENKDEVFIWFWGYACLKHFCAPKVVEIDKYLRKLYFQRKLLNTPVNILSSEPDWEVLKEVAKNFPLPKVAEPHLEKIRKIGNRITALCPFHTEKTASFTIYILSNTFHCFGCQTNGDVIDFKMRIDNQTFQEVIKELTL